ncbi:MAG TPA: hypothetical protein VFT34_02985 [Verrucomicrobiae bacterium]|nr:hypothetical protein [Verrucomicrobiae bacterium]
MADLLSQPRIVVVRESSPDPELLRALGRLARGLSALFWGLPFALVVCLQTAIGDLLRPFGVAPALVATGLLFYGLTLLGKFQRQERLWITALDRVQILALINLGLSPFLYWWSRVPSHHFLGSAVQTLVFTGLLFLIGLNVVLQRLTAMLPDEALRLETRLFTRVNRSILLVVLILLGAYVASVWCDPGLPDKVIGWLLERTALRRHAWPIVALIDRGRNGVFILIVLLPVAMTMALLWKIKEVILASVFGQER